MSTNDNKALSRRVYDEIFNGRNLGLIDELLREDFVEHEELPGLPAGREGMRYFTQSTLEGIPDLSVEIEDMIAEGDKVVARVRFTGTHEGEFMGFAATGNKIDFAAIDVLAWHDGKATDHWGVTDTAAMLTQVGAIDPVD